MTEYRRRLEAGEYDPPGGHELRERAAQQPAAASADSPLSSLSKGELIERAQSLGVSPANASMTKEELTAAIEQAGGQ